MQLKGLRLLAKWDMEMVISCHSFGTIIVTNSVVFASFTLQSLY